MHTVLQKMLSMANVCIAEESHKRLPKDLQTLVDLSHQCKGVGGQTNVVCLGDLNHFQVHPGSDFTCVPYFRSLPQSQSRAVSLSEGAQHNHPHNKIRSAQFTEVLPITSGLEHMCAPSQAAPIYVCGAQIIYVVNLSLTHKHLDM